MTEVSKVKPKKEFESMKDFLVSYQNRKECILRKTKELSILCGVQACVVCFGPDGMVESWPKNLDEVKDVFNAYADYEKFGKKRKRVEKSVLGLEDGIIPGISSERLKNLVNDVDSKLQEVKDRIELLKKDQWQIIGNDQRNEMVQVNESDFSFIDQNYENIFTCNSGIEEETELGNQIWKEFLEDKTNFRIMFPERCYLEDLI